MKRKKLKINSLLCIQKDIIPANLNYIQYLYTKGSLNPIIVLPSDEEKGKYYVAEGHRRVLFFLKMNFKEIDSIIVSSKKDIIDIMTMKTKDGNIISAGALSYRWSYEENLANLKKHHLIAKENRIYSFQDLLNKLKL